jgi:Zn-dependent peptidase ImmA (M78 family)
MIEDFQVVGRSAKDIEARALAWRDALRVPDAWAPQIVDLIETDLPKLFSTFALIVRPDDEMGDAEAYAEFNPPLIAVRESIYWAGRRNEGRARMTFAHEFGHLVLHPGASKPRLASGNLSPKPLKPFESAEWQARKFAACFLMPTHIVRQFGSAKEIAEVCFVSLQAAEIRFREVGHIPPRTAQCVSDLIRSTSSGSRSQPTLVK